MKKTGYKLIAVLLLSLPLNAIAQTFVSPFSDLADPHIVIHNGYYYCTGTTAWNVSLKKATTLEGLKTAPTQVVFSEADGGPCCDYWAPEIHRLDDKWYIYYTAHEGDKQYTFVIENSADDPLSGTWLNRGRIFDASADYWAIDGTILSLNDKNYFIWSGVERPEDGDKPQRLYIGLLSNPWTLVPGRVLISSPQHSWERNGNVNEGPEILIRNGKVFLVYSANGCWTADYILGMLSMDVTENPMNAESWSKHPNPLFSRHDAVQAFAPGHHCFFTSPDGTEDWFAYHATPVSSGACDHTRMVRAQQITYHPDGTPNFGRPFATGKRLKAPSGEPALPETSSLKNGIYKIIVQSSAKTLDVEGCSHLPGANVQQWSDNDADCQKWIIQATEDGFHTITSVQGGLVLEVEGASRENSANVQMWAPNGAHCQQWQIVDNGDGYVHILSRHSNKALGIASQTINDGGNLHQFDYLNASNQHFQLELISTQLQAPEGTVVWESFNNPGSYVRHQGSRGRIDDLITQEEDAYWRMVPGLIGSGVSFQSFNNPNAYLRHRNGEIHMDPHENSTLYKLDATFIEVPGLANPEMVSFRSYNFPSNYILHQAHLMYSGTIENYVSKEDATFVQYTSNDFSSIAEESQRNSRIGVYPNPSDGRFKLTGLNNDLKTYSIRTVSGKLLSIIQTTDKHLDLSAYPAGIYFLTIHTLNQNFIKKIVIQ